MDSDIQKYEKAKEEVELSIPLNGFGVPPPKEDGFNQCQPTFNSIEWIPARKGICGSHNKEKNYLSIPLNGFR